MTDSARQFNRAILQRRRRRWLTAVDRVRSPTQTATAGQLLQFTAQASDANANDTFQLSAWEPAVRRSATINPTTGVFSWAPSNAQAGSTYAVQLVVLDAQGLTATENVNITVNAGTGSAGQAPTLPAIPAQQVVLGNQLSLSIQASDVDPTDTFHYGLGTGTPSGVAIDPNSGQLTWTPTAAQASATFPITVTATDAGGLAAETTFNVTISTTASGGGGGGSTLGSGLGLGAVELGIGAATLPVQAAPVFTPPANSSNASSTFTTATTFSSEFDSHVRLGFRAVGGRWRCSGRQHGEIDEHGRRWTERRPRFRR